MRADKHILIERSDDLELTQFSAGWYYFESSSKIKKGKIYSFSYFGTAFVCFRNSQDEVLIFNAYCPHLGANIGMGGRIQDDNLVCPFHGWKYNSSGKCVEIPYCKNIPKRAALKSYQTKEFNSSIYIYFDAASIVTNMDSIFENDSASGKVLQILADIPFKKILTLQLEKSIFNKLIAKAASMQFNFKPFGAGFFIAKTNFNMIDITLLITITPINNKQICVSFAAAFKKTLNPFRNFSINKIIQEKFKLLSNASVL